MKKKFTLDEWLKDKSQKLVTAFGEPAKIVFTEGMGNYPVLAVIWDGDTTDCQWFTKDGRAGEDQLFFVTEQPGLNEFEKGLEQFIKAVMVGDNHRTVESFVHEHSAELLALAKKEIVGNKLLFSPKEIQEHTDDVFNAGKAEAKKELPMWLKDEDYDKDLDGNDFHLHSVGLAYKGYYIPYLDLINKLPREDE